MESTGLSALLDSLPDAVAVSDNQGRLVIVNSRFEQLFGYTRHELSGKPADLLLSQCDAHARHSLRPDVSHAWVGRCKDGAEFPAEVSISPVQLPDGLFCVTTIRVATERLSLATLRPPAASLAGQGPAGRGVAIQGLVSWVLSECESLSEAARRIIEAICQTEGWQCGAMWEVDPDAGVLRCIDLWHVADSEFAALEAQTRSLTFQRGEGLPGKVWASGKPGLVEDLSGRDGYPRTQLASALGLHGAFAFPVVMRGEVTGVVDFFGRTMHFPDEGLLETFAAAGRQIGLFISRQRSVDALRESEERFRMLSEGVPEFIWTCLPDGRCEYLNRGWIEYTGIPWAEQLDFGWLQAIHPEDRESTMREWHKAVEDGRSFDKEYRIRGSDGIYRWFKSRANGLRDENGKVIKWFGTSTEIDELRRAQEALRESEHSFRTMADTIPQLAWMADASGWVLWYNQRWYDYTGATPDEALGRGWEKFHHPDHLQRVVASKEQSWQSGEPWEDTYPLRGRNGEYRWYLSRALPLRDSTGTIVRWFGTNTDVTEHRQSELNQRFLLDLGAALQTASDEDIAQVATRKLCSYLGATRCGWMTIDEAQGTFTIQHEHRRAEAHPLTGTYPLSIYGDEQLLLPLQSGTTIAIADTRTDHRTAGKYEATFGPRGTRALVFIPLLRNSEWVGLLAVAEAEPRQWTTLELGLLRSAAERIWPAYEVERSRQAERGVHERLAASENRFRRLVEADVVGIVIADQDQVIEANDYFLRMLGYDREELEAGRISWITTTPVEYLAKSMEALKLLQETGTCPSFEKEYYRKDGSRIPVLVGSVALDAAPHSRFLTFIIDQTGRKRLEEQFRQAQKLESVGQLAGGIAHDFNNLLTVIMGYTDLVLSEVTPHHSLYEPVQEISNAAARATTLTRQLLTFSRRQTLQLKNFVLADVVRDLEKMLRRLIAEDIELVLLLDTERVSIHADPGHIEQVVINLAVNARDAMPSGGTLTIETSALFVDDQFAEAHMLVTPGNYVMLAVADTGTGMSEEVKSHIFEPFFTTKEQGRGTGLGLATVYGVVKESRGSIWVYSEPGQGSVFKLLFPAAELGDREEQPPPAEMISAGHETILLVEDEPGVRKYIRRILERYGYRVLDASNGVEALDVAAQHTGVIDMLLTDVVMPRMGGLELAQRFASIRPGVPVLHMSGYTDRGMRNPEPVHAFIQKPFTPAALLARIRALL